MEFIVAVMSLQNMSLGNIFCLKRPHTGDWRDVIHRGVIEKQFVHTFRVSWSQPPPLFVYIHSVSLIYMVTCLARDSLFEDLWYSQLLVFWKLENVEHLN